MATRASQFAAELLVVGITWWYSYQWHQIQKGVKLGHTISSLLLYNGSLYFLFLAALYILDIIFRTAPVPEAVLNADSLMTIFYDPITSILVCHFVLSLRQFDNTLASTSTFPRISLSQLREHTDSIVFGFGSQASESLPAFISSFAHPVHVDSVPPEVDRPNNERTIDYEPEEREISTVDSSSQGIPPQSDCQPMPEELSLRAVATA